MNRPTPPPAWTIIGAVAACLVAAMPVTAADVVSANLRVWLDAGDHDADGVQGLGVGTVWRNKADTGSMHDATLLNGGDGPVPAWAGDGSLRSPYAVQFRNVSRFSGGYAAVANSTAGTALDTCVYTYEVWVRRNGVGGSGESHHGAIIAHGGAEGWGVGGMNYNHGPELELGAQAFFAEGGNPSLDAAYPGSARLFTTDRFHHIVFTRAGDGPSDSAFYYNGLLRGQFRTSSSNAATGSCPLTVGGRICDRSGAADYFLDCDIAVVRVYTAALAETDVATNFSAEAPRFGLSPLTTVIKGGD
jgi:hypothetical protein